MLTLFISAMVPLYSFPEASESLRLVPDAVNTVHPVYSVLVWFLLPPLAILTDTKFGRYKTLLALLCVRVLFSIIQLLILVLHYVYPPPTMANGIDIAYLTMTYVNQIRRHVVLHCYSYVWHGSTS